MSKLRLVDAQPMETLPKEGEVFAEYELDCKVGFETLTAKYIKCFTTEIINATRNEIRYLAWSHRATCAPEDITITEEER